MAIIACRECGNNVSNQAATCPHCGVAVAILRESTAAGTNIVSTQETAKKFKVRMILSFVCFFVGGLGVILMFYGIQNGITDRMAFFVVAGLFFLLIGAYLYISTKIKIWWHHK